MIIKRVETINFNGKDRDFVPKKVNSVIDKNGTGKTSLLRAMLWGLTGEKTDADNTEVRITLADDFVIERSRYGGKNACKLNNTKVTEKALNQAIEDKLGIAIDNIKLSASEAVLEAKKPEDLLKALIGFVSEKLTVDKVISHLTTPSTAIIDKVKTEFPPAPTEFSLDEISNVYGRLYQERKAKSLEYKRKEAVLNTLKETTTSPKRKLEVIEDDLLKLQLAEKSASDSAKKLKEWERASALEKKRISDMAAIEKEGMSITFKGYTSAAAKLQDENRAKAESELLKLTSSESTIKSNIEIFERTLKNLDKPVCPISEKLICTTDKTAIKAELEKSVKDNEKLLSEIAKKKAACNETLEAFKVWKKGYDESLAAYQKRMELSGRYKALKENPIPVPEKPVVIDASKIVADKAALVAEKKNAENFQMTKKIEIELLKLKNELTVIDYLVNALKDKGEVKEAIIRDYLSIFEDTMNARASVFCPGYEVSLAVNGGLKMSLKTPYNKEPYDSHQLSGGESLILRFLMLDMLNQLTGTHLMFLDNIEVLDDDALTYLVNIITSKEFEDEYDHVFIAGVNHPDVIEKFK